MAARRRRASRRDDRWGRRPGGARRLVSAMLAAAALSVAQLAAAQPGDDAVRTEIADIAESGRYQMELPETEPEPPRPPPEPLEPFELGDFGKIVLIVLLAGLVLYVVAQLLGQRIAPARRGRRAAVAKTGAPPADEGPSAAELADAEAAALAEAAAGRYAEAIHILLLGAIGRLRERDAKAAARSLTSREILARHFRAPEAAAARDALAALVAAVEVSRFGGRAADLSAFERCLEAYRALRRALGKPEPAKTNPGASGPAPRVAAATEA